MSDIVEPNAIWHVIVNSKKVGPLTRTNIVNSIAKMQINRKTLVWREGMQDWEEIGSRTEFTDLFKKNQADVAPTPPPIPKNIIQSESLIPETQKSKKTIAFDKFCHACGEQLHRESVMCPQCGVPQKTKVVYEQRINNSTVKKDRVVFLLLTFFLGFIGIHRFYIGQNVLGVIFLVSALTGIGILFNLFVNIIELIVFAVMNEREWDNFINHINSR